jgi:hypothetical protein
VWLRAAVGGIVSLKKRLRVVVVCAILQLGVMVGAPMRPDEIEELMHQMNQPKMAHVLPPEGEEGTTHPSLWINARSELLLW